MLPEHDERFRRIVDDYLERPGGDYAELLRRGHVTAPPGVDLEELARRDSPAGAPGQDQGDDNPHGRRRRSHRA